MTARFFWFITLVLLVPLQFRGQASTQELPSAPSPQQSSTLEDVPEAVPADPTPPGAFVRMEADHQSKEKNIVTLTGNVEVRYFDYIVRSQELIYDTDTGVATSAGHVELDGGPDNEHISAARADINLKLQTAHFFNAVGTISPPDRGAGRVILESTSPLLFTAAEVVKDRPGHYTLYSGIVTSCELPHPDWDFRVHRAVVDDRTAKLYDSYFQLVGVPLFYFPYATHSLNTEGRQSGFLIPIVGTSSTKGLVLGDEYYWAINRSADLWLGVDYFSARGFAPLGQFRYKGAGLDFALVRFTALKDRGQPGTGIDQGGIDMVVAGRHDFDSATRVVANLEYLNSYIYRQAFAENFTQAVASEVKSDAYIAHEADGYAEIASAGRYQNFENTTGAQVRVLHVPTLEADALDHPLGTNGFYWNGRVAADGLERSEPGFTSSGVTKRVDIYPKLGYIWQAAGWTFRPEIAARETFYSESTTGVLNPGVGFVVPQQSDATLNRKDAEAQVQVLAPSVERDFGDGSDTQWRHVIQPEARYRFVGGIDNFKNVLRFDETDIVSDTNEFEYGLSQRLYIKHKRAHPCKKPGATTLTGVVPCHDVEQQTIQWFVGQKYFIDPAFGGAVNPGIPNVLESTLDFSGAAYLTSQRNLSPVISRLKWSSTQRIDLESDVDYDTKRGELLSSNTFIDLHQQNWFAGSGISELIQPAESLPGQPVQQTDFLQVRWSLGYGGIVKRGFSVATNGGYDVEAKAVQYSVVQTGYNWNCCGFSAEYRRFALGSTRNENQYLFNFTLAGVATAGNLKRAERLF
jgi:LPS-assembly protein